MDPWLLWAAGALVLLIAEVFASGLFLGTIAVAALLAAAAAGFGAPILVQLGVFAVANVGLFWVGRPLFLAMFHPQDRRVETNVHALLGASGVVLEAIDGVGQRGRVLAGGDDWRAESIDGSPIPAGARVSVVSIRGVTLTVRAARLPEPTP